LRSLTSRRMKSVMILEALDGCMVSTLYENYLILLGIFPLVFFLCSISMKRLKEKEHKQE
jgi:hypothetical protein